MNNFRYLLFLGALLTIFTFAACDDDEMPACPDCEEEPIGGPYDPQSYDLQFPDFLGVPVLPDDNPLTEEGVMLGRMLFFDPILSVDSSMSCFSCHLPEKAFTDGLALSVGVQGLETPRSSMSLVNLALLPEALFWDGRSGTLEDQALLPIEAHDELNDSWENVEEKLRRHPDYPRRFRAAFGIEYPSEITRTLAVQSLAQFQRTIISADSKYDRIIWQNVLGEEFTEEEEIGFELFEVETAQELDHPGCTHCHNGPNLTDNKFHNNGLDDVASVNDFADLGRGAVTGISAENGTFRTPTLRNIALTAPYMHDGRFETLGEVLDHYAAGGHGVDNENGNIRPFDLTAEEKQGLISFLHTLTDTTSLNNPAYQNPF